VLIIEKTERATGSEEEGFAADRVLLLHKIMEQATQQKMLVMH
jgi:hypothetical protein